MRKFERWRTDWWLLGARDGDRKVGGKCMRLSKGNVTDPCGDGTVQYLDFIVV